MAKIEHRITKRSPFSKKDHTMTIVMDPADYDKWVKGILIRNALPYLTPDEREFLMRGITPDEWSQERRSTHMRHAANALTNAIQHMMLAEDFGARNILVAIEQSQDALTLLNNQRLVHLNQGATA